MTERPLRAAVVQLEAVHEEVVSPVFHALLANGLEPTAFLNERILERGDIFGPLTPYGDRVRYLPLETPDDWEFLAEELGSFDVLVMNTFQRQGQARLVRDLGLPALGIVHNPRIVIDEPACLDVITNGLLVPMTLAPHVTSVLMGHDPHVFADTVTLNAWMWDLPESAKLPAPARRRITIPGAVDFRNREYPLVLDTIPALLDQVGRDSFEIAVVGGGPDRAKLQDLVSERGLDDVFWFAPLDEKTGFVPSEVFYEELARSTFLLPLLPEARRDYRVWKITLAVCNSIGFTVPAIVDRWTALVYDLPSVAYPAGHLADGLTAAVTMPEPELVSLRADLAGHRATVIEKSTAEMGRALATALRPREEVRPTARVERDDINAFLDFASPVLPSSYSQRFQDFFALWESGGKTDGYFVEFGALNGRDFSNSYLLERLGWSGVVAEPHPGYTEQVRKHRSCFVSTKCVFDSTGDTVTFRAVKGRPALSSIDGFGTEDERSHFREEFVAHEVETITLEDLLVEAGAPQDIDFLSIDTEGSELRILQAFDFDRFRIRCIAVEHNEHQRVALHDLLSSKGYRRKWDDLSGHDDWYVHESAYPDWTPLDADATGRALAKVKPFKKMYDERRDILTKFLDDDTAPPPAQPEAKGADSRKYGGRNPKWRGVNAGIDYTFMKQYLGELGVAAGLSTGEQFTRVGRVYRRLSRRLQPTLALEIGAHEASFSLWIKDKLPDCRVVAYEANPYVYERYKDEVVAAGVEYTHRAVSADAGTVKLQVPQDFRGVERRRDNQMASLRANRFSENHETVEVPSVRLDDEFPEAASERIVAWIDVEGANEQVLLGASQVLRNALAVFIEVEATPMWEGQWLDTDVVRYFKDLGFTLVMRDTMRHTQFNLTFVRNDVARKPWVAKVAASVYRTRRGRGPAPVEPAPSVAKRALRKAKRAIRRS